MLRLWTAYKSRFIREEEGATMVEYGLMVALIAIVVIVAVGLIGTNLNTTFEEVADTIVVAP
jgi:pilus assembly protein Flp/PilA